MRATLHSSLGHRALVAILAALTLGSALPASGEALTGAGSSAAAPVYAAWATAYARNQDIQFAYDPAGSSAGIHKIKSNEVGFGASDVAPPEAELAKDRLVVVPTFVTGAVAVVNLAKTTPAKLRLSGEVLAAIFLGQITHWNAPEIQSLNAGVTLPDLAIKPVVRSDASGTTYYFTEYLSKVSPEWTRKFGANSSIAWPASFVGASSSGAVAKTVRDTVGAIGYVDYNYVAEYRLNAAQLRNAAGEFVTPGVATFRAALAASEWMSKGNFHATLTNLPGTNVWPITMGSFAILPRVSRTSDETACALRFLVWAMLKGDKVVEGMSFVRLPDRMQAHAYKALSNVVDDHGRPLGHEAIAEASRR